MPACPPLPAGPRALLLQGPGPALSPSDPSLITASGPHPCGIVAATNFAIKTLPKFVPRPWPEARSCGLRPGLGQGGAKDCSPDRAARGRPSTAGVSLLGSLAGLIRRAGPGCACTRVCARTFVSAPHTSVQNQLPACTGQDCGQVYRTGPAGQREGLSYALAAECGGGQLSTSGSWHPPDPLELCGNDLWAGTKVGQDRSRFKDLGTSCQALRGPGGEGTLAGAGLGSGLPGETGSG